MDSRAQLQTLARAIDLSTDIERAWAGLGPPVDLRKHCGICRNEQPVRVPFLRHVCHHCAAVWVPGICGDCANTSVTFTLDGQLSRLASCGCGGQLRQVGYVPKPRAAVDPEVAAARKVVVETRKKRASWTTRVVLVAVAVLATVAGVRLVHHNHAAPTTTAPDLTHVHVADDPSLPMPARGRLAAERLTQAGRINDVFACAGELPTVPRPAASATPSSTAVTDSGQAAAAFLAGCLKG
ncbi:MAG: hypothetical protein JWO22_62 [Frankiales bacterium]|nr:hypothetical protein [Frankiales bacterium]